DGVERLEFAEGLGDGGGGDAHDSMNIKVGSQWTRSSDTEGTEDGNLGFSWLGIVSVNSVSELRALCGEKGVVSAVVAGVGPLDDGLEDEGGEGEERQQRGGGKGADELVFVVEDLDVQRQGVGDAADVS